MDNYFTNFPCKTLKSLGVESYLGQQKQIYNMFDTTSVVIHVSGRSVVGTKTNRDTYISKYDCRWVIF